jgi:DNA-binding GntR family transcriptional regulator
MSDEVAESRQEASAALFNNRYLLPVVDAIRAHLASGDTMVTVRQVAQASQLADSLVRPVVLRLAASGLLRPLPRRGPRAPLFYSVSSHAGWEALVALATALAQEAPARSLSD